MKAFGVTGGAGCFGVDEGFGMAVLGCVLDPFLTTAFGNRGFVEGTSGGASLTFLVPAEHRPRPCRDARPWPLFRQYSSRGLELWHNLLFSFRLARASDIGIALDDICRVSVIIPLMGRKAGGGRWFSEKISRPPAG